MRLVLKDESKMEPRLHRVWQPDARRDVCSRPHFSGYVRCLCEAALAHKAAVSFGPNESLEKNTLKKERGEKDLLANNPHHTYFSDHPNININTNSAMGKFM